MEKTRDSRRGTAVSSNFSSSRRRSRGGFFKDSFGVSEADDGGNDSIRDRSNGGKKDHRSSTRRRLGPNDGFHDYRDEDGDESTDESLDEDQHEEDEAIRSSSSLRRTNRTKLPWKGTDEMIGVLVPRRARSASVKRLQDSIRNVQQSSSSSPARHSAASISPPSSNASMKSSKRVKPVTTKPKPPKTSKVSISESEVEVAQFLYGLTRLQSQHSPSKPDPFQGSSPKKLDNKQTVLNEGSHSFIGKSASPASTPASAPPSSLPLMSPQNSGCTSSAPVAAPKRKKPRPMHSDEKTNTPLMNSTSKPGNAAGDVLSSVAKVEQTKDLQSKKLEEQFQKADRHLPPSISCTPEPQIPLSNSSPLQCPLQSCKGKEEHQTEDKQSHCALESKPHVVPEARLYSAVREKPNRGETKCAEAGQTPKSPNIEITEAPSTSKHGGSASFAPDVKAEVSSTSSSHGTVDDVKVPKIEIDLMAPPGNSFPDNNLPDVPNDGASKESVEKHGVLVSESIQKSQENIKLDEKVGVEDVKLKTDANVLDEEEKFQTRQNKDTSSLDKQSLHDIPVESCKDENKSCKGGNKQIHQKLSKSTARQAERAVAPAMPSTPVSPVTIPGWPGGFPPFGYPGNLPGVPSIIPLEGNASVPNAPLVFPHQARPNRCATHCFIARLIYYQQQLAKLNPFWHAASSATLYGAKPYNLNILPSRSEAMFFSGPITRNPNLQPGNHLSTASPVNLNGQNAKDKGANISADTQRKQQLLLPQPAHPGAALIYPANQPRTGGSKHVTSTENVGAQLGPAVTAPVSASYSNISTTSDVPQYLAMLHGNYPFPVPPAYRAHINQQQQPTPPFFSGSFYPSLVQFQPQSLAQTQNMATSGGPSSSQKLLQAQQHHSFSASSKTQSESKHESVHPAEDVAENRVPHTQKKIQTQNAVGNQNMNSKFRPNYAVVSGSMTGKQQAQQVGDQSLPMRLKNMEVPVPVPSGHPVFQNLPDIRHLHYQLSDHLQSQVANQSKAQSKAASASSKTPESNSSQSTATAAQLLQHQVMTHSKPAAPSTSACSASAGITYSDRIPVVYSNAATIFPVGSREFSNLQNSSQWKITSSQRMGQTAEQANAFVESSVCTTEVAASGVGSSGGGGGMVKPASSSVNSSRNVSPTGPGSLLLAQSVGAQCHAKTQQLFFSNHETLQKRQTQAISTQQGMFPGNVNVRRSSNHQNQQGTPALTVASPASYLAGVSKGPSVYSPLNGGSMAVMAAASYAQSAASLSVKSAEQKPTTA